MGSEERARELLEAAYREDGAIFEWVAITQDGHGHFSRALLAIARAIEEEREACAKAVEAIESPYDHHRQTPENCAYVNALDAAEVAIRSRP